MSIRIRATPWVLVPVVLLMFACGPVPEPSPSVSPPTGVAGQPAPTALPDPIVRAPFSTSGWKTDFNRATVALSEIQSGGPPRDGIPPIDRPKFVSPEDAAAWLKPNEPVVSVELGGVARAYPLQILIWHEIVNDTLGGVPIVVTFCPLCNTAIAFDRRLDGVTYDFGTTGNLRNSDLVMWDRQTESWWQQVTGEAIIGELAGRKLQFIPASIVSFADFRAAYSTGEILSRETGAARSYGRNPYTGYDDINSSPFLFSGRPDGRLRPMERVVTVSHNGEDAAYPFSQLQQVGVVHDVVGGQAVVIFYSPGAASALDRGDIADSRDVGAAAAFVPEVDGRPQRFHQRNGVILDEETGSQWSVLGHAVNGSRAGKRLAPVVHGNHFWFAWAAFKPQTRIWSGGS